MMLTISCETGTYDIMTNANNTIGAALGVLEEKGMVAFEGSMPKQVYSVRKKKNISVDMTYRQGGIYQGDILKVKEQG